MAERDVYGISVEERRLIKALMRAEAALSAFCVGGDWEGTMPGNALKEVQETLDYYERITN